MNATELLCEGLGRIASGLGGWTQLFAEDAIVEFPYAASLGTPARLEGRAALSAYLAELPAMESFAFDPPRIFPSADPDFGCIEVHATARIPGSGQRYVQDYVMFGRAREGELVWYREYWDPNAAAVALGWDVKVAR